MSASPAVVAAATTLADWARTRRRVWSDAPLNIPVRTRTPAPPPALLLETPPPELIEALVEPAIESPIEPIIEAPMLEQTLEPVASIAEAVEPEPAAAEPVVVEPELVFIEVPADRWAGITVAASAVAHAGRAAALKLGELFISAVEHVGPLLDSAGPLLIRGAAMVSIASIVFVIGLNRGRLFGRWDHVASMVIAAASRPPIPPPPPVKPIPEGMGRINITAANSATVIYIDGAVQGATPVTLDLPAGAHRVLYKSPEGSVERTVRVQNAELSYLNEAIYPGWVALTTPIDLSLSESGHALKRDERGYAILAPGAHDIHLDNNVLGVHEVRRVVVTPGETTRVAFAPHTSTISLTTNELSDVWIDGTPYGQAPLVDQPLSLGVHDVRVRSAAHERWLRVRSTVQPLTINVDLTAN